MSFGAKMHVSFPRFMLYFIDQTVKSILVCAASRVDDRTNKFLMQ